MTGRWLIVGSLTGCLLGTLSAPARAQDLRPDTIQRIADTIPQERRVPRNAFIRSMLVPGWGHFYIGSPKRGAFYIALQSTSWFMLVKTIGKLNDARAVATVLTGFGEDSVRAEMALDTALDRRLQDQLQFEAAVATYPGLASARALVDSRQRHRQDWIVYTLFFTFVGAADAYVAAHLKEFPEITTTPRSDGGVSVGVRFDAGRRRR